MIVLGKKSKLMGQPIQDWSMLLAIIMSKFMLNFGMLNMPKIKILLVIEIFFLPISVESHWLLFFLWQFPPLLMQAIPHRPAPEHHHPCQSHCRRGGTTMSDGALYTEDVVAQVGVEKTAGCQKNTPVDSVDIERIVKLSHCKVFIATEAYLVRISDFVSTQGQFCCPTHLYLVYRRAEATAHVGQRPTRAQK